MSIKMSRAEAENISRYLRTKEIQLPSTNKWLIDCINWYKSHLEVRNIYNSLQDYVCIQWLLSDLQDIQHGCLPNHCKEGVTELTGKYFSQVNWVRDISQPCYTQLQAMKNNNIADSNEHVSAEETKKQNWEPSPKRVLMMEITDGFTTLKAMEHSPIHKLAEPFIPGFKVVLIGPIECRKGILFLKSNNISLLGGEVDFMSDMYSKENMLSRCLNIIPPCNEDIRRETIGPVTTSPPTTGNITPQVLFNDANQLPDSTSFIENHPFGDNRDAIMADDDDDMLCQLPDTVFNDADNFNEQRNQLSPVLGVDPTGEVESSTLEEAPVSHNRAKTVNRPKLFPSMEDLRLGSERSCNAKQSTLGDHSKQTLPQTSIDKLSNEKHNISFKSVPNLNITVGQGLVKVEESDVRNDLNLNDSIANRIEDILCETDNIYPQFKRVKVKVLSIIKLKIRNGEWNCCASVSFEDRTENVTFCDKVLEKLFGTSAAEVEVIRSEMAKNLSLKEKVNNILKAGQTRLKMLNCLMVMEYTSQSCTPNIVSIHEDTV